MPDRPRFGLEAFAGLGLALSAAWALSVGSGRPGTRLLPILLASAFLVPLRRLGTGPSRFLERSAWLLVAATALYGFAWSIYPVLPEAVVRVFPQVAAYLLVPLLCVFLAARTHFAHHRALVPCSIALLVIAALDTGAPLRSPFAAAAGSAFVLLAIDERGGRTASRLARLGVHLGLAAGLGLGITRLLPWAQPLVEGYIARSMDAGGAGSTGFSLESNLGSVDELTLSPRVLLNVETESPTKLRAGVFLRFDGRRWEPTPTQQIEVRCSPPEVAAGLSRWLEELPGATCADLGRARLLARPDLVRTRVIEIAPVSGVLPAPGPIVAVRRAGSVRLNALGLIGPPATSLETYGVLSLGTPPAGSAGREMESPDPAALAVPADTDLRVRALADGLAAAAATPEGRVAATSAFLQRDYRYSLTPGRFRSRQPVAEFLLEKKRGYCEYFASAAALLLRLQGVPTRYVRGFTVREANRIGGRYVVREADAHAWIEVHLAGRGWVEVDPTPAAAYEAAHGSIGGVSLEALRAWLAGWTAEWRAYLNAGDARAALRRLLAEARDLASWASGPGRLPAGALAFAAIAWLVRRRGLLARFGSGARLGVPAAVEIAPELRGLLLRLDAAWKGRGRPRPLSHAWREHLGTIPPGELSPQLRAASEQVIECYYRARYAGIGPRPGEVQSAREALERALSTA